MNARLRWFVPLFAVMAAPLLSGGVTAQDEAEEKPSLTIGSLAPEIDVEHWIQDGEGFFKPVSKFQKDKVYVIEFWATWCGPCISSMPHLSELQKKYRDEGLQIVSISDEDLETVETFLQRDVPQRSKEAEPDAEAEKQTFADLTKNYCLTTDPDRSVSESYMRAAGRNGIPCAFIVGKSQRIEWIGHPMQMDEPVAAILAGTWDAEKFAAEYKEEQELNEKKMRISRALRNGSLADQLALVDTELLAAKGTFKRQLQQLKLNLLLGRGGSDEQVAAAVNDILSDLGESDPNEVNNFAWGLYQMAARQRIKDLSILAGVIDLTAKVAEKASGQSKAMVLDTLAHLHHVSGDLGKAIEIQRQAVAVEGADQVEAIGAFLQQLEQEVDAGK